MSNTNNNDTSNGVNLQQRWGIVPENESELQEAVNNVIERFDVTRFLHVLQTRLHEITEPENFDFDGDEAREAYNSDWRNALAMFK